MKRDESSPAAYRADVDGELSEMLELIRRLVFDVAGDPTETIQYGMLHYPGLCHLAAQKHYVALYVDPAVLDGYRDRVADCGKSCLRFRRLSEVQPVLLRRLLGEIRDRSG